MTKILARKTPQKNELSKSSISRVVYSFPRVRFKIEKVIPICRHIQSSEIRANEGSYERVKGKVPRGSFVKVRERRDTPTRISYQSMFIR